MSNVIGRTIESTLCKGFYLDENQDMVDFEDEEVRGKCDITKATKKLRKKYKKDTLCVTKVNNVKTYYKMTVEDFISQAERIEK